ncbi:MAG: hypothetical protein IRY94_14205 [Rhodospirillaceae bacterium]|nr:hypothetical protein [Rhodospirillaceae bacterium]
MEPATSWLDQLSPLAWVVIVPALALLWLLWVLLPFAVFGVKGRLDRIAAELADIREELQKLNSRVAQARPEPGALGPGDPAGHRREPALGLRIDQDDRLI